MKGLLCVALLIGIGTCLALPETIRIGALFDDNTDPSMEWAFRSAVERISSFRLILPRSRLVAHIDKLNPYDSFHSTKKVCYLLKMGVVSIFGPQANPTASHVQSICDALEVPHIETRWDYRRRRETFSINLHPQPGSLSRAYLDLVRAWGWKQFTILYEDHEGLIRLQEILKLSSPSEFRISIRQLPEAEDYRPLLKRIKRAGDTKFLIDASTSATAAVLQQAQQIGLMSSYYSYIITNLDLHTIDLEDYRYGSTNITGVRLLSYNHPDVQNAMTDWMNGEQRFRQNDSHPNPKMTTQTALIYDAVHLFAKALNDLDLSQELVVKSLSCDGMDTWIYGNSLINYMKLVQLEGLTGSIKFDMEGFRTDFDLQITELTGEGLQPVGTWNIWKGVNMTRTQQQVDDQIAEGLHNKTFIVTTILSEPYAMLAESSEPLSGNARFEGFNIDLIHEISKILGFNYTFKIVDDGNYGTIDRNTGEWNGMIKELLEQKADMVIGDLSIIYDREQVVDFVMPHMNSGISILYRKPQKKPPELFSFLSPLSIDVWIYMMTAYLGVSILLFFLARITPYEWVNPHPCVEPPEELENQFSLLNCLFFVIGSLMQQGGDIAPKIAPSEWAVPSKCPSFDQSVLVNQFTLSESFWFTVGSLIQGGSCVNPKAISTRLVACLWWFFTLIMISSYTANLAAFLTVERMESPIESVEDLAKQTKIKYGSVISGTTTTFFRDSSMPIYQRMWAFMESTRPSVFTKSNTEGVERVMKSGGSYAYLMESSSIEYQVERKCDLMQIGGPLDSKGYGIALPQGSPYRPAFNSAVLHLQETNRLILLKRKWWKEKRGGGQCKDDDVKASSAASELGLANVGGVFVVLMGGMGVACIMAVIEFIWKTRKLAAEDPDVSICRELMHEMQYTLKFSGNTRPMVRKGLANLPCSPSSPIQQRHPS